MTASTSVDAAVPAAATIDGPAVRAAVGRAAASVTRHAAWLTRLDAVLGDGDHGDNLAIGFAAVEEHLRDLPDDTPPGELLRAIGHRLVAAVGGASGPLYGTAFIEAGFRAGSAPTIDAAELPALFAAAAEGLARRGRCTVGDKTILDSLQPMAETLTVSLATVRRPEAAYALAVQAAAVGARSTRGLEARRGLALRLGSRSVGHLDPGAVSCLFLLCAMGRR